MSFLVRVTKASLILSPSFALDSTTCIPVSFVKFYRISFKAATLTSSAETLRLSRRSLLFPTTILVTSSSCVCLSTSFSQSPRCANVFYLFSLVLSTGSVRSNTTIIPSAPR